MSVLTAQAVHIEFAKMLQPIFIYIFSVGHVNLQFQQEINDLSFCLQDCLPSWQVLSGEKLCYYIIVKVNMWQSSSVQAAGPGWDKLKHKNAAHTSVSVVRTYATNCLWVIFLHWLTNVFHLSFGSEYFHSLSDRYLQCQHEANFHVMFRTVYVYFFIINIC